MNRQKFHVKKGDQVQVISGNHTGATGKVLAVLPKKQQVLIEGVRMIKKHTKKSQERPQGGIVLRQFGQVSRRGGIRGKFSFDAGLLLGRQRFLEISDDLFVSQHRTAAFSPVTQALS